MKETGKIVNIENGLAKVKIMRNTVCGDCGACQIGQDNLVMETLAKNPVSAKIGDQVEIETQTIDILKASFIIYTFPLLMFIVGSLVGYISANYMSLYKWNNYIGFGIGILFTAISYLVIKNNEKKFINNQAFQPIICKIIE